MEDEKLSYYVVIPMPIFEDKDLTANEKLLYGLISSLINKEGYCYASNEYLAKKLNISTVNISKTLSKMKEKGYIYIVLQREGAIVKNRKIYIDTIITNDNRTIIENDNRTIIENDNRTIITNDKYINKTIKGINNYIKEIYKEKFFENETLDNKYKEYLKMRYEKKCKATETTIKNQVEKLKNKTVQQALSILKYSIDNGYQGLFEQKCGQVVQEQKIPHWYGKEIKKEEMTKEEESELKKELEEFN